MRRSIRKETLLRVIRERGDCSEDIKCTECIYLHKGEAIEGDCFFTISVGTFEESYGGDAFEEHKSKVFQTRLDNAIKEYDRLGYSKEDIVEELL
jgi:hypothetical protein